MVLLSEVIIEKHPEYMEIAIISYGNVEWGDLLTAYNGQSLTYDNIGNPLTWRNGMTMTWQDGRRLSTPPPVFLTKP